MSVTILIEHLDLRDDVSGRRGLRMKFMDRARAKSEAGEHCQT